MLLSSFLRHAQILAGMVHTYALLFACGVSRLLPDGTPLKRDVMFYGSSLSCAYFVADAIYIALFEFRSQGAYIAHHAIAVGLYVLTKTRQLDPAHMLDYLFFIELSNVCISAWYWAKDRGNNARVLYEVLTPVFSATYVPIRSVALPVATLRVIMGAQCPMATRVGACLLLTGLQLMSWIFSKQLIQITLAKMSHKGLVESLPFDFYRLWNPSDPFWFNMVVYYCKFYYYIYLLVFAGGQTVPQMGILLADMAHIVVSLLYYASGCTPLMDKIDYVSVLSKIVLNSTFKSEKIDLVCYGILSLNIAHTWYNASRERWTATLDRREYRFVFLSLLYACVVAPVLLYERVLENAWLLAYAAGAVVWVLKFPESVLSKRAPIFAVLNSLGWMHVCVWLGDELLRRSMAP